MKNLMVVLVMVVLVLVGCSASMHVNKDANYELKPTEDISVVVFIDGSNSINPEYVTVTVGNVKDSPYNLVYFFEYCNNKKTGEIYLPAKGKKDLKFWSGCAGRTVTGNFTVLLYDITKRSPVSVKEVNW